MTGIERVRVGDLFTLSRRAVAVDAEDEYREIGIRSFGKGIFHKEPVSGVDLGNKRVFRIEPGDLVISNVFAWEGAIAVASEEEAGMVGSHRFMTFVPTDGRIDPSWAAWFFLSESGLARIGRASPGSAGRNRTLAVDRFKNLEIPLPPIHEQQRTAAELNCVATSVESLDALAQRSARMGRATRSALTLRQPGTGSRWNRHALDEVLSVRCTKSPVVPETVYPMAGVYSFGRGLFARPDLEGANTSYKVLHRLGRNQLVMSRLKAWEGALALVPPDFDGQFLSPEFPTFDINPDVAHPQFLGALLTSESFWSRLKGESKGIGARKERVHAERLLEQEIALPPLDEQQRRSVAMEAVAAAMRLSSCRSDRLAALVPAVLNQAFAGLK